MFVEKISPVFEFKNGFYTFINPHSYRCLIDTDIQSNVFDNIYIDGFLLCSVYRFFMNKKVERVSFDYSSIADIVFMKCVEEQRRVAIIGSDSESNTRFHQMIKEKYDSINIVLSKDGYFDHTEEIELIDMLLNTDIDFVLCGMGSPRQEQFLTNLKASGWKGAAFTCGGFIHQTASLKDSHCGNYYPYYIDKLNLRFLYRIYKEPKLIKRYFFSYPLGVHKFVMECLKINVK